MLLLIQLVCITVCHLVITNLFCLDLTILLFESLESKSYKFEMEVIVPFVTSLGCIMKAAAKLYDVIQSKISGLILINLSDWLLGEDRMVYISKSKVSADLELATTVPKWSLKGRFSLLQDDSMPFPLKENEEGNFVIAVAVVSVISRL